MMVGITCCMVYASRRVGLGRLTIRNNRIGSCGWKLRVCEI